MESENKKSRSRGLRREAFFAHEKGWFKGERGLKRPGGKRPAKNEGKKTVEEK